MYRLYVLSIKYSAQVQMDRHDASKIVVGMQEAQNIKPTWKNKTNLDDPHGYDFKP